jgi:hypothetical protein
MGVAGLNTKRGTEPSGRAAVEVAKAKARIGELQRLVGRPQADLHFFREALRSWGQAPRERRTHLVAVIEKITREGRQGDGPARNQINFIPRSDACPSRPTMMWSWTVTPKLLAIAMMFSVILTSWVDGVGSPDG